MKNNVRFEFSAGGIILDGENRVLMINTKNLSGEPVWTFPKGHIEKNETAEEAALRETLEETGYSCRIVDRLDSVQYWFKNDGALVKKTVMWFLMKPIEKTGVHDDEIIDCEWLSAGQASLRTSYDSDRKILKQLVSRISEK